MSKDKNKFLLNFSHKGYLMDIIDRKTLFNQNLYILNEDPEFMWNGVFYVA